MVAPIRTEEVLTFAVRTGRAPIRIRAYKENDETKFSITRIHAREGREVQNNPINCCMQSLEDLIDALAYVHSQYKNLQPPVRTVRNPVNAEAPEIPF